MATAQTSDPECDAKLKSCKEILAKNTEKCNEVIKKADETIAAKNKALQLADVALKNCVANGVRVQTALNERNEELGAWYRSPFVMIGLGFLVGGMTYTLMHR